MSDPFDDFSATEGLDSNKDPMPEAKPVDLGVLDKRRFDFDHPPRRPESIFKLGGQVIATPGNLVIIQSQVKSGKSAFVGAMIASPISEDPLGDFLGVSAAGANGKAIIHFDTEQSRYDADQLIRRALRRADVDRPPPWLRSYCLTDVGVPTRRRLLAGELERAAQDHGGVFAVFLDGVGDLAIDVNDAAEANGLVGELHALAIRHDCPIICVLHENPGENTHGKTRGHLGSQLERKAESNLRLLKDNDGVTVVFTEKSRSARISRDRGPRFKWDDADAMHRTCATMHDEKAGERRSTMQILAEEIFNCPEAVAGLSWTQIHERIESLEKLKRTGARRHFDKLISAGLVAKNGSGLYTRAV
jgi:hypothetical protein